MSAFKNIEPKNNKIDIQDFYEIKIAALWRGVKQEHISFWALCAYFFFEYVRPQSIYPFIDIVPWAQITLLMALTTVFLDTSIKWVSNIENKIIIVFLLVIIMSGIFAFNSRVSLDNWLFFFNWFIVYFLFINIVNTEKRLFIFILLFLLFSFKMSQHGFISWAQRGFSFTSWGLKGAPGWFSNSGEFSIQMLIFVSLSMAFIIALKGKWGRYKTWFFYLMPITGLFTIVGASSRGAQLALLIIGLWLLLKWSQRTNAIIVLALVSLSIFFLLPDAQLNRFYEMGQDETSIQRMEYWQLGLQLINERPLLGIGYFNWIEYLRYIAPEGYGILGRIEKPHNIFVEAGAEMGYLGLILFLAMICYFIKLNIATRVMAKKMNNQFFYFISYGLDGGLIGYSVAGFFVSVFYYPFFWVQLALSVALYTITRNKLDLYKKTEIIPVLEII